MADIREASIGIVDPAQAISLSVLVDLEARWENLRTTRSRDPQVLSTLQDLQGKQKAYEAFRTKLVAYNKRYKPLHVPELLLNTPSRLGIWCRAMRSLFLRVENDLHAVCPAHLVEKAYRWADLVGNHLKKPLVSRAAAPASIREAVASLETVSKWCDELASVVVEIQPRAAAVG